MSAYREEADELDTEILGCIERYAVPDFDALARRLFAHQLRYNEPYARYCASLGVTPAHLPANWEAIPPVPSGAFKAAALCTFDPSQAALVFETSGTTQGVGGRHYLENGALYDAALLAEFQRTMLAHAPRPLRYLLLVPNPAQRPHSSLGYMMRHVAQRLGDGHEAWLLDEDVLHVDRFVAALRRAAGDDAPLCIAGTAFAFVQLLDALREAGISRLPAPAGTRVMETGGFKGRTRVVERAELYADLARLLDVTQEQIVAEYGMTELCSQYYDDRDRVKHGPPWLRPRVVGANGQTLPQGVVGALVHVDLANRSSCLAIQTEDLGVAAADGGIVLIGREAGAQLRGCSLDAEGLRALAARA